MFHSVLFPLPPTPPTLEIVREKVVVAAPPFAGFTTQVSADGATALTAGYDGSLVFWSIRPDGTVAFLDALRLRRDVTQANAAVALAIGPSGRQFAVSTWDGQLEVWDRVSLRRQLARKLSTPAFANVAFHPARPWLLIGAQDGAQRIDLATGKAVLLAASWPVEPVPKSDLLVSAFGLTNGTTGRLIHPWKGRTPNTEPLRVSPDGKLLFMAGEDPQWTPPTEASMESAYARSQTLRTWRISDGKLLRTMPGFWTMSEGDRDLAWLDDRRVAVPGLGVVRDVLSGRVVGRLPGEKERFQRPLFDIPVVLRSKGADRRLTLRFPDPGARAERVGFAPGKMVALHELRTTFRNPGTSVGGGSAVTQVTSAGKTTVANTGISGGVMGFDEKGPFNRETWATQGAEGIAIVELSSHPLRGSSLELRRTYLKQKAAPKYQTDLLPNRNGLMRHIPDEYRSPMEILTAVQGDGFWVFNPNFGNHDEIFAVSVNDGRRLWRLQEKDWRPQSTSLAANRDWVAFERENNTTRATEFVLARASTGEIVHHIPSPMVSCTAFSPDGQTLALITDDSVAILDLRSSEPTLRPVKEGSNPLDGNLSDPRLYWTPSGRLVVAGSLRPIQVYDPSTGRLLASARFFGDGTWSALRSDGVMDGPAKSDVRIWENGKWKAGSTRATFFLDFLR